MRTDCVASKHDAGIARRDFRPVAVRELGHSPSGHDSLALRNKVGDVLRPERHQIRGRNATHRRIAAQWRNGYSRSVHRNPDAFITWVVVRFGGRLAAGFFFTIVVWTIQPAIYQRVSPVDVTIMRIDHPPRSLCERCRGAASS